MKKILLATMAIATLFASCSKEPVEAQKGDDVIIVNLPDNVVSARTVESQQYAAATITLTDVTVFLLNGNTVSRVETFSGSEITNKEKRIDNVASGVNNVIVVANIPSANTAAVQALTSGTAIEAFAYTVASQNTGIATVTRMGKGTPMVDAGSQIGTPTGNTYKSVSVELTPLTARFEIGTVKEGVNVESVELIGVWINNYYTDGSKSTVKLHAEGDGVWVTSPATTGAAIAADPGAVMMTNAYTESTYYNAANAAVNLTPSSHAYAYHVFAGSNIPHIILLVKGKYETADASGNQYFLGYVTYTKLLNGGTPITAITANTIYKIGLAAVAGDTTPGIVIDGDDITDKPEKPIFDLGITVTTTPWTVTSVTPGL